MKAFFVGAVLLSPFVAIGCGGGGGDCTSHASTFCQESVTYWTDSCGNLEEVKEQCQSGCNTTHDDCKCTPNCLGLDCGPDPICGESCGTCSSGWTCNALGQCISDCIPNCAGRVCGPDPVCGQSCGTCTGALECVNGECICIDDYDCDDNSICIYESCTLAYGREYRFTVVSVEVSQNNPAGDTWDAVGGLPDPFVCFYRNDQTSTEFCTYAKDDTLNATYNESFEAIIRESDKWLMYVWDEDISDHDAIGGFEMDPITVPMIKSGGIVGQGDYVLDILVNITPVL